MTTYFYLSTMWNLTETENKYQPMDGDALQLEVKAGTGYLLFK